MNPTLLSLVIEPAGSQVIIRGRKMDAENNQLCVSVNGTELGRWDENVPRERIREDQWFPETDFDPTVHKAYEIHWGAYGFPAGATVRAHLVARGSAPEAEPVGYVFEGVYAGERLGLFAAPLSGPAAPVTRAEFESLMERVEALEANG